MVVLESILVGIATAFTAWYVSFWYRRRRLYELSDKINGPKGLPFIGIAHTMMRKSNEEIFKSMEKLYHDYGTPSKFWAGPICIVMLDSPKDLQMILNSPNCLNKSSFYDLIPNRLGLLTSKADVWQVHRKMLNPAFNTKILNSLIPIFNEKSKILLNLVNRDLVGKGEFDIYHIMSACTLETLFETAIGLKRDVQNDKDNEYLKSVDIGAAVVSNRMYKVWLHVDWIYKLTDMYKMELKHMTNGIFQIGNEILDDKLKMLEDTEETIEEPADEFEYKTPQIFIDQLLRYRKVLSKVEISDEINTFLGAGHETSALTMSSALLMLAMHPDVQQKVVEEIKTVCSTKDMYLDSKKLNELIYLEMVIKETMRLFPVLPMIGRETVGEVEIENHTIVPAGVTILIPIYNLQRNTKYWGKDAALFNPDRFLPENFAKIDSYSYIPFGAGPRICIGLRYAMMNMKTILAYFLMHNKVSTTLKYEDLQFRVEISMKIVQKYMLSVEKRNLE